jgi:hypothetical protein
MPATLDAGRAAIQSGEAFKPPPAVDDFDEFGEALGSKGGGLSSLSASVKSAWGSATRNLGTFLNVAETQVKVIELEAKSQGREPTEEELEEACGPLSFLTKIPNILGDALSDIFGKFNDFVSAIGETVGEFMGKLDALIADVANAIDEVAQAAAQVVLDAFEAANAVALQAIEAIESVVNTVATAVNDAIQFATDAFNKAVDKLLAFADGLNFASLFSLECQKEALEEAVDKEKIADPPEVQRVIAPTVVNETDNTKTAESLSVPQTVFAPAESKAPPPSLDILITRYQTAARAYKASIDEAGTAIREGRRPNITRTQQQDLDSAQREALQNLREAAVAQRIDLDSLSIYGPNFDSKRVWQEQTVGRDKNGDEIVTRRGSYTDTKPNANLEDLERRYVAAVREFNRADDAQIREKNRRVYNIFTPITSEDIARHRVLVEEARVKARAVTAIIREIPLGDQAKIFSKIRYTGPGLKT